jgi:hypothetical protein
MVLKALKEKFLHELEPSEKLFFLKKTRECIANRGYLAGEDLFYYCYFLTIKERFRSISPSGGEGYARFLLVEGTRDVDDAITLYEKRLEKNKLSKPDPTGCRYLEYFSEQ